MMKLKFSLEWIVGSAIIASIVWAIASELWDQHLFNTMTTAQHLEEAKKGLQKELPDVEAALRHVYAIKTNKPAESKEQVELMTELEKEQFDLKKREADLKQAEEIRAKAKSEAKAPHDTAITQLAGDLKNLGYEFTVEPSDSPDEVTITSSDFAETDHRVRFLSFMRGRTAPIAGVCWVGISKIRLRSSKLPFLGFDESYSIDCFK
jgi:hypothetical protein